MYSHWLLDTIHHEACPSHGNTDCDTESCVPESWSDLKMSSHTRHTFLHHYLVRKRIWQNGLIWSMWDNCTHPDT